MSWFVDLLMIAWLFSGWAFAFRTWEQRNDAYTDLMQLVHDYDVEYDELRRTHGHREVELYFDNEGDNE